MSWSLKNDQSESLCRSNIPSTDSDKNIKYLEPKGLWVGIR